MTESIDYIQYCRDMVRADDRARYETSLFAPAKVRPALWALYAFNQEVAKTRESVSEPALGEIRLQWWRDVLQELQEDKKRDHPVISAMATQFDVQRIYPLLYQIIEARAADMYDEGPANFDALKKYAQDVGGKLSHAALILSTRGDDAIDDGAKGAAIAAGSAWAMLGLVRAVPFHWASNRNFLPGNAGQAALATTDADKMYVLAAPSIEEMIDFVKEQIGKSMQFKARRSADVKHVFILNALSKLYIKQLAEVGNNPFKLEEPSDFMRMRRLFSASLFGL